MRLLRQVTNIRRIIQVSLAGLSAVAAGEADGQGFLIPTVRTGMVFDHAGRNLYISDGDGLIKTFNLQTRTFARTYNLGGWLWGIDIAPDDSSILAAQASFSYSVAQARFQRVNLATGAITNINYTRAFGEGGAWDVKIGSNGLALATTHFNGSGWTPLRQIDLSTNAITGRSDTPGSGFLGQVTGDTQIYRSADGTRLLFMESNITSGPTFTYSAITDTFGPSLRTNTFRDWAGGAVNRNGNLVAETTGYYPEQASLFRAPSFDHIRNFNLNGLDGGLAFDSVRDILYAVNTATDEIIAYNTITFAELFRFNVGEPVGVPPVTQFDTGTLVASADGRWLALETDSGIRLFKIRNTAVWYLNGSVFATSAAGPSVPRGWRVIGVADFNADGHTDCVLFNEVTRDTAIWYMNGNVRVSSAAGPSLPGVFQVVTVADFNSDGHPDYLLFNTTTRATVIWYMHNNVHVTTNRGPIVPGVLQVVAVADLNSDGYPDYLLFNTTTRATVIWYMHNNVRVATNRGPTLPAYLQVVAVADFNSDGYPDYLLFNTTTRATVIWFMHNNVQVATNRGPILPADWQVAAVADFNGDGHPDYLLFNSSM
jgi:elongation factor P hydroxylase